MLPLIYTHTHTSWWCLSACGLSSAATAHRTQKPLASTFPPQSHFTPFTAVVLLVERLSYFLSYHITYHITSMLVPDTSISVSQSKSNGKIQLEFVSSRSWCCCDLWLHKKVSQIESWEIRGERHTHAYTARRQGHIVCASKKWCMCAALFLSVYTYHITSFHWQHAASSTSHITGITLEIISTYLFICHFSPPLAADSWQ